MSGVTVTGMEEWLAILKIAPEKIVEHGKRVVGQGCNNIKKDWRTRWEGHPRIKHLPRTISYDVDGGSVIHGEVGPVGHGKGSQAPLAVYIEFGTHKSFPIPGGQPALDAEEPRFNAAVEDLAVRILEAGGF